MFKPARLLKMRYGDTGIDVCNRVTTPRNKMTTILLMTSSNACSHMKMIIFVPKFSVVLRVLLAKSQYYFKWWLGAEQATSHCWTYVDMLYGALWWLLMPLYKHVLTLIPAWISNDMPSKVLDEITHPFPNFNGRLIARAANVHCL